MKKIILKLGKNLNKKEQKEINGGTYYQYPICKCDSHCNVIDNGRCENIGCPTQAVPIDRLGTGPIHILHPVC